MGPPPRSFAADAHDCIMVRVLGPTEYKVVPRLIRAPERELPSEVLSIKIAAQAAESQRLFRRRRENRIAQDCVVGPVRLEPATNRL
jgi:hypothetical protein